MSNLRNKLIRLAHGKPALRKHILPLLREAGRPVLRNHDGGVYDIVPPSSMYDNMQHPPFGWATPAALYQSTEYPLPWRVSSVHEAEKWILELAKKSAPSAYALEPYVTNGREWRGFNTLLVGLRGGRLERPRSKALDELYNAMKGISRVERGKGDSGIKLIDDLPRNVLRK